jgi:hypothetical protein
MHDENGAHINSKSLSCLKLESWPTIVEPQADGNIWSAGRASQRLLKTMKKL